MVCLSWLLEYVHRRKTSGEPDESVNPTRQSTSLQALAPPRSRRRRPWCGRLECALLPGRGLLPHPGTRRHSWTRLSVLFAEHLHVAASLTERRLRRARRCSLRPRSPPSSTPPEVCLETMGFDFRRGHGTTTTHAPHSSPKAAWVTTSTRCQVGRSWRFRLHERRLAWRSPGKKSGAHGVTSKNKETIKFVSPTRNKMMGSRNMKTCRRRAGGNFHLTAALDRVGILTVTSGEDATQWTALRPAQERLLAGDAEQLRLDPHPAIRETTKLCFHAFQVPLQRRGGRRNRLLVRLRSRHPGAGARRRCSHGDGRCRGLGREWAKRLVWMRHGIAVPVSVAVSVCPRPRPCSRLRQCLFFGSLSSFQKSRQGFQFLISNFSFSVFLVRSSWFPVKL